jgi:hypothetical protein
MVGSVNASRENFETGVRDMAQAEAEYDGWLRQLLTHPVRGLDSYRELFERLQNPDGASRSSANWADQGNDRHFDHVGHVFRRWNRGSLSDIEVAEEFMKHVTCVAAAVVLAIAGVADDQQVSTR